MSGIRQRLKGISPGTVIPKPEAKSNFTVKGWGKRRDDDALIYFVPNNSNPNKPYQKGVNLGEWDQAFRQLWEGGTFTRHWFDSNMPRCSKEGGCNFTTIGGVFQLLGVAKYASRGVYVRQEMDADAH
jgi:hypothetical protein